MAEHFRLLAMFYRNPRRAASETLDHARLGIAAVLALATALLLQAPGFLTQRQSTIDADAAAQELLRSLPDAATAEQTTRQRAETAKRIVELTQRRNQGELAGFAQGLLATKPLTELLIVLGIFVPAGIALLTLWQGRGSPGAAIQREFGSLFLCVAMSWSAARLPLVAVRFTPAPEWVSAISTAIFLIFAAFSWSVALGARMAPSLVTSLAGGAILAGSGLLSGALSPMLYYLGSPWLLYYFWGTFSSGISSVGSSVSGRQSFRRALEATTVNPRDGDAHYQLGLIQLSRHNLTEAESRFRTAASIEPDDADYAFSLGRALSEQGRHQEALPHFERAAKLNDKTSGSEVWRELGATRAALQQYSEAVAALTRYVDRREYDPIGLVHLGEALEQLGRGPEARQMFERALEACRTMPSHRRAETRPWANRARSRLHSL